KVERDDAKSGGDQSLVPADMHPVLLAVRGEAVREDDRPAGARRFISDANAIGGSGAFGHARTFAKHRRTVYDGRAGRKDHAMSLELLKKDVCAAVDALRDELLGISHAIHAEPELALEEFLAAARLADTGESHDIKVQREA